MSTMVARLANGLAGHFVSGNAGMCFPSKPSVVTRIKTRIPGKINKNKSAIVSNIEQTVSLLRYILSQI